MVSSLDEALSALEKLSPDLIIVDYDDEVLNRDEFLARFVEGEKKLRVVLLSLQSGKEAIVYDRRTLAASQIDNWLEEWSVTDELPRPPIDQKVVDTKAEYRRVNMKHFIIAAVLVIIVAALVAFGLYTANLAGLILPVEASRQGEPIDQLFRIEAAVIAFLFSLIVVLMVYSIVVFRRKRGDTTDAAHVEGFLFIFPKLKPYSYGYRDLPDSGWSGE